MGTIETELKHSARILHARAIDRDREALGRLRALPQLRRLDDDALVDTVRRRHCLEALATELGFRGWSHLTEVLAAPGRVPSFGDLLCLGTGGAHWNIWSSDEALSIRREHGGYLLAFRHQFFVADQHYLDTIGLDASDLDWDRIGRDWVVPADSDARYRLYEKRIQAVSTRQTG